MPHLSRPASRREFLAGTIGVTAALTAGRLGGGRVERVVLVAMAGGVRTRETLGTPANVPNLVRLSEQGTTYARTRASNLGHYGATLSIFTGIAEARGIRDNTRGSDPTVFEYVRKSLGLAPGDVWVSTSGGVQEANLSYSLHPEFGAAYGASTVDGDGIFNRDFKALLDAYGPIRPPSEQDVAWEQELRRALDETTGNSQADDPGAQVEAFLLDELRRGTQELRGLGASDAKAFRVARNVLAAFKPKLLAIVARDADVAHQSFSNYEQVLRRNDEMLGELWSAIKQDKGLSETTALFVLPEFGRDADLNARRGLDHGDDSDDLNYVSTVCWGPGIRSGQVVTDEVATIDICKTVCELMSAEARYARGRRLPRLLS